MQQQSTHAFIKAATRSLHSEVEALSPLSELMKSNVFCDSSYMGILCDFEAIFRVFEKRYSGWLCGQLGISAGHPFMPLLQRHRSLLDDIDQGSFKKLNGLQNLRKLESQFPVEDQDTAGLSANAAWRWGLSYVLLGQMLGSAHIMTRFKQMEGFVPSRTPTRFLGSHAAVAPKFWKVYLHALEQGVPLPLNAAPGKESASAADYLLHGATTGFEAFLTLWKTQETHPKTGLRQASIHSN